jgi:hypothetical protein
MSAERKKAEGVDSRPESVPKNGTPWYRQPTAVWPIVLGLVAAWRYIVPVHFNGHVFEAIANVNPFVGMAVLSHYPEMVDDRAVISICAANILFWAVINLLPNLTERRVIRWNVVMLPVTLGLAAFCTFIYVPTGTTVMTILYCIALLVTIGAVVRFPGLKWASVPLSLGPKAWRWSVAVLVPSSLYLTFYLIPSACGRWQGQVRSFFAEPEPNVVFLLHMKDRDSPLHEELVDILVRTTDYLVVRLSDQVPHPKALPGSSATLPALKRSNRITTDPLFMPMLVRRESIECVTFVPSPRTVEDAFREKFGRRVSTTQPAFKVKRMEGGGYETVLE